MTESSIGRLGQRLFPRLGQNNSKALMETCELVHTAKNFYLGHRGRTPKPPGHRVSQFKTFGAPVKTGKE